MEWENVTFAGMGHILTKVYMGNAYTLLFEWHINLEYAMFLITEVLPLKFSQILHSDYFEALGEISKQVQTRKVWRG